MSSGAKRLAQRTRFERAIAAPTATTSVLTSVRCSARLDAVDQVARHAGPTRRTDHE